MYEAMGSIGSLIGGISVALTVVYLAVQVRVSGQATKANAAQGVMQAMSECFRAASESPQLCEVISIAYKDASDLKTAELTQFFFWCTSYFRLVELAYYHHKTKNIPDSFWDGQVRSLIGLKAIPAITRFWTLRKAIFSSEFQEFMEKLEPSNGTKFGDELRETFNEPSDA